MTADSFPDFITARRRELELTLGDVASGLGVSPITVSNWSNGDSTPKPENLVALAELLDVPAGELARMAGVTLKSAADGVNLMPAGDAETHDDLTEPLIEETEVSEPVAEVRLAASGPVVDPAQVEPVGEPAAEVPIPVMSDEVAAEPAEVPIPVMSDEEVAGPGPEEPEPGEEAIEAPDAVPAFVAAEAPAGEKAPAARRRPTIGRPGGRAPAVAERQVTTLPLTYIEDPKQLMRYRIRWALTVVILFIMFIVLLWASRELISALSEVKQAVTPGGIGNG